MPAPYDLLDSFARPDGALGGTWGSVVRTVDSIPVISGGKMVKSTGSASTVVYNATMPAAQRAWVRIGALGAYTGVFTRIQNANTLSVNAYAAYQFNDTVEFYKLNANAYGSAIAPIPNVPWSAGDYLILESVGSTHTVFRYVPQTQEYIRIASWTDGSFTTGQIGAYVETGAIEDFGGGRVLTSNQPSFGSLGSQNSTGNLATAIAPGAPANVAAGDLLVLVATTAAKGPATLTSGGRLDTPMPSSPLTGWNELVLEDGLTGGYYQGIQGGQLYRGITRIFWRIATGTSADNPPSISMSYSGALNIGVLDPVLMVSLTRYTNVETRWPFGPIPRVQWFTGDGTGAALTPAPSGIWSRKNTVILAAGGAANAVTGLSAGSFLALGAATQRYGGSAFTGFSSHVANTWLDERAGSTSVGQASGVYTKTLTANSPWGIALLALVEAGADLPTVVPTVNLEVAWNTTEFIIGSSLIGTGTFGGIGIGELSGPGAATFIDTTDDAEKISISRGRDDPQSDIQAGTMDFTLFDNAAYGGSSRYNPENASSDLYGKMLPMREARFRVTFEGVTYTLFRGLVRDMSYDPLTRRTQVHCEDLMLWLSRYRPVISPTTGQTTGGLIYAILVASGVPTNLIDVDTSQGDVVANFSMAGTEDSRSALQGIADLLEAERGVFYISKDGKATYRERYKVQTQLPAGSVENVWETYQPGVSVERVVNTARVTKEGNTAQVATDASSAERYGPSDIAIESPYFVDDAQALALAQQLVFQLKDPRNPVWEINSVANYNADVMLAAVATEIIDRIQVVDAEQPGLAGDYYIERITYDVDSTGMIGFGWALSRRREAGGSAEYFVFDDSALSGGDVLGYY